MGATSAKRRKHPQLPTLANSPSADERRRPASRAARVTFYEFPAEHGKHLRSTNPIESGFATVRLGTYRTKGCLGRETTLAMVLKLLSSAKKSWRGLNGSDHIADVIQGVRFEDGIKPIKRAA